MFWIENKNNARKFEYVDEAQKFCMKYYYEYVQTLDRKIINKIMTFESSGRTMSLDGELVSFVRKAMQGFPCTPYDIIAYRGGDVKIADRPVLAGSFIKGISMKFANESIRDLHKILIKKGSKIIPMYPVNQLYDIGDPEMEFLFDASKAKKHISCYEYR